MNPARKSSCLGFVNLPVIILVGVLVGVGVTLNSARQYSQTLGESKTLLAENWSPPGGGESQPPPQNQSAPPPAENQQPANNQPPPQNSQPIQNTQPSQPAPQNSGSQPSGQNQFQPSQNQQGSFNSRQETGRQNSNPGTQNFQNQQNQPNNQSSPNSGPGQQGQGSNFQPNPAQMQQFQRQFQQEAAKAGFQINGKLPEQFVQFQQNTLGSTGSNSGPSGNSSQNAALPSLKDFPTISGKFEVLTSGGGGGNINLNDANTRIQLGGSGGGQGFRVLKSDGTQVQIEKEAFEKINTAIKLETGSDVSQTGNTFVLRRGQVEANTQLPISFNVATKTFTVQTPNGEQQVNVLPDEVAQKVLQSGAISQIHEGTSGNTTSVSLTQVNNQAVYEVEGTSSQKFLGFVPVSITKTVFVSAQTGNTVSTNSKGLFSGLLDTLSF